MKTVYDLSREQINELKQSYICQLYEDSDVLEEMDKEEIVRRLVDIEYEILTHRAYELYKKDWCSVRGYQYEDVCRADKKDMEYNGQMFVCKAEFEGAEFLDREYMRYLLNDEDYWCYEKVMDYHDGEDM